MKLTFIQSITAGKWATYVYDFSSFEHTGAILLSHVTAIVVTLYQYLLGLQEGVTRNMLATLILIK